MRYLINILTGLLLLLVHRAFSWDTPRPAVPGQFPFQVSFEWHNLPISPIRHLCGGAILTEFWIISSGYCLTRVQVGILYIKLGRHDIAADDAAVQTHQIIKTVVNPKYPGAQEFRSFVPHDLALVKVAPVITFNSRIQPLKLPKKNTLFKSQRLEYNMVMSGWGSTAYLIIENHPTVLMTVQLPIISNKVCVTSLNQFYHNMHLDETQMCTRPINGAISACIGDYGGPLIQYNADNVPILIGIQSWGTANCNQNHVPPVYTRVSSHIKWIKETLKANE
ncbi:PREDICTED: trypsin-like [Ceratosolen solmsi marchali]|uniref:Trypsin-like n=1 Tax=Ceratosolen solmsi marchali TaxID=326594 RepID=A0AAJ7DZQ2_9HYME|nr:PREDICTED: trypsin-like [Ceratosolen solmsi marchali]